MRAALSARRALGPAAALIAAGLLAPPLACAHGVVGCAEVPVPPWMITWAVCGIVVGSWLAGRRGTAVQPSPPPARALLVLPRGVEVGLGVLGVAGFAFCVWAGLGGAQDPTRNLLPDVVFVAFWIGVPVLSLVLGDWWALVSPWRAIARGCGAICARLGPMPEPIRYPTRLGAWPAAVGILAFAWVELVCNGRDDPRLLATLALGYLGTMLTGCLFFGEAAWTRSADPFGVYFRLVARLAAVRWQGREVRRQRPLWPVAGEARPPAGSVALVLVALGSTAFDGFSNSTVWVSAAPWGLDRLQGLGISFRAGATVVYSSGLLLCVAVVAGLVTLAARRAAHRPELTLTLVPIVAGYLIAHYCSLLVTRGQDLAYLVSDPRGTGADLFGTARTLVDYNLVSPTVIFYVQVLAVLAGHLAAVVLGRRTLTQLGLAAEEQVALDRGLLVLAVALSCLALWLLSAVNLS